MDADALYGETLSSLLEHGTVVASGKSLSVGSEQKSHEILNFTAIMASPQNKLIFNPVRRINLPAGIARFLWMMAGSDRLADIAFYEPKVNFFTDDGISIPGSNYGQRILRSRPGLNQLQAVIERLREDPGTRRAAISIYHPEDAVRMSRDIPCAFGVFYHIRENGLHATTVMRSNNAFILLPYNIFEFALLAEVVAAEVEVPLVSLTHTAISMHLYERDVQSAKNVLEGFRQLAGNEPVTMPQVPSGSAPLDQIRRLVILEAELRHASEGLAGTNIEEWIEKGEDKLDSYWRQFYYLLLLYVIGRKAATSGVDRTMALEALESVIEDPWYSYLPPDTFKAQDKDVTILEDIVSRASTDATSAKIIPLHRTRPHRELRERVEEYEREGDDTISWREFAALEDRLADQLAARDLQELNQAEFNQLLSIVRQNRE